MFKIEASGPAEKSARGLAHSKTLRVRRTMVSSVGVVAYLYRRVLWGDGWGQNAEDGDDNDYSGDENEFQQYVAANLSGSR